ncbi:MAG: aspartate aminotransferase family protein, partial [Anaerovoracaceae bacterium]
AKKADIHRYAEYFRTMLNKGVWIAPAQFEAMFISDALTEEDIQVVLAAAADYFGV